MEDPVMLFWGDTVPFFLKGAVCGGGVISLTVDDYTLVPVWGVVLGLSVILEIVVTRMCSH